MASKPEWIDTTAFSDLEVEDHVLKVVAYLKTPENPNIKAIADAFIVSRDAYLVTPARDLTAICE
jgi:hypothetical protein